MPNVLRARGASGRLLMTPRGVPARRRFAGPGPRTSGRAARGDRPPTNGPPRASLYDEVTGRIVRGGSVAGRAFHRSWRLTVRLPWIGKEPRGRFTACPFQLCLADQGAILTIACSNSSDATRIASHSHTRLGALTANHCASTPANCRTNGNSAISLNPRVAPSR